MIRSREVRMDRGHVTEMISNSQFPIHSGKIMY